MAKDRRLDVLRAIVEDYVSTNEPVGSRALVERHVLGVSPATIRNDMAALEEAGLIVQPHTSAGRVPTDKGYRLFVDRLATIKPLSAPERRAIETFMQDAVDLDDVVDRAVRLLAQLTHQVAVVQYPSLRRTALRHVELVPVSDRHLLVVIITEHGRVEQRTLELSEPLEPATVAQLRVLLNVAAAGRRLSELDAALAGVADEVEPGSRAVLRSVAGVIEDTLARESEERVVVAGTANLVRGNTDVARTLSPVLEALEEQVVLLRLLADAAEDEEVSVRIGRETQYEGLAEASLVSSGYGAGPDGGGTAIARIASLGPLRMDYPGTIASVRAVARYLSRILAS